MDASCFGWIAVLQTYIISKLLSNNVLLLKVFVMEVIQRYILVLGVLLVCSSLSACGQSGDLYLPYSAATAQT